MRHAPLILPGVLMSLCTAPALARIQSERPSQPAPTQPSPTPPQSPDSGAVTRASPPLASVYEARLEQLSPTDPAGYLVLGEDVMARARDPEDFALARTLLVLSFDLDRQITGGRQVGGSALLALAALSPMEHGRRWLRATARRIDPRYTPPAWLSSRADLVDPAVGYAAATALGLIRRGDGIGARQLLSSPDVVEAIRRYDPVLAATGIAGVSALVREADRWPCPECQNNRIVRSAGGAAGEMRLCSTCRGDPGIGLNQDQLLALLRVEASLLGENPRRGAVLSVDSFSPFIDPDPAEIPRWFRVDPSRTLWRAGSWVSPSVTSSPLGDAPKIAPATPPPPEAAPPQTADLPQLPAPPSGGPAGNLKQP